MSQLTGPGYLIGAFLVKLRVIRITLLDLVLLSVNDVHYSVHKLYYHNAQVVLSGVIMLACQSIEAFIYSWTILTWVCLLNEYRCNIEDILLEMDRILRPEGAVIFRDEVDAIIRVKKIVSGMRWDTKMVDHEDGPLVPEKILIAVKQYWVASGNFTSTQ